MNTTEPESKVAEQQLVDKVVAHFSPWFQISREVYDDKKIGRIDLIFQDHHTGTIFGVECKSPGNKKGTNIGDIILQAVQYSRLQFWGKKIPIFLVPSITHNQLGCIYQTKVIDGETWFKDKHNLSHRHHTVNGLLGSWNIGEVRKIHEPGQVFYDFTFSNQVIYSTKKLYKSDDIHGLHKENYTELLRKINQWEIQSRIFKT